MRSPCVRELPRNLKPVGRDTFIPYSPSDAEQRDIQRRGIGDNLAAQIGPKIVGEGSTFRQEGNPGAIGGLELQGPEGDSPVKVHEEARAAA